MKNLRQLTRRDWYLMGGLTLLALLLRLVNLPHPGEIVFDETYFAKFAQHYLTGTEFFDAEPPLGKFLIAFGEWVFGSDPNAHSPTGAFGWRVVPALFGTAVIPLMYLLAKRLFGGTVVPFFAGALALLDGFLLVESRTALLDGFVITFNLATYLLFIQSLQAASRKAAYRWLVTTGVVLGLGISLKWITLAFLGPAVALLIVLKWRDSKWIKKLFQLRGRNAGAGLLAAIGARKENLFSAARYLAWLVVAPVAIYMAVFSFHVPYDSTHENLAGIHKQIYNYHHNLEATHPYGSKWYTWPLMTRPVALYFESAGGQWQGIVALGNPVIWWAGALAALAAAAEFARRRNVVVGFLLFAVLAHYGPWALIDRVLFIYHYAGALPFVILLLAYWLGRSWEWRPRDPWPQAPLWFLLFLAIGALGGLLGRSAHGFIPVPTGVAITLGILLAVAPVIWLAMTNRLGWRWGRKQAAAFIYLAVLAFIYFYPVWTGLGLEVQDYQRRMWLRSWI